MKGRLTSMKAISYPDLEGAPVAIVVPDDRYRKKVFSLGKAYVAAALLRCNARVKTISCDIGCYEDHELVNLLRAANTGTFFLGGMFPMILEIERLIGIIKSTVDNALIILGGPIASPTPEFILRKTGADIALVGETEITIPLLMTALADRSDLADVPGIAFLHENEYVETGEPLIAQDLTLSELGLPAVELFPVENYIIGAKHPPFLLEDRVMTIVTGRGCPFNCNFCYRVCRFRARPVKDICDEMEYYIERYKVNSFYFLDDLVMLNEKRIKELCVEIINRKLNIKFNCTGRVNIVNTNILEMLKEAGCISIFYGIESGDQNTLNYMQKKTTVEQNIEAVRLTRQAGLFCTYGIMFGQPGEDADTLARTVKLIKELSYADCPNRMVSGCIPFPGTALYDWCKETGRIRDDQDFYDKYTYQDQALAQLPINMTNLPDHEARHLLAAANAELTRFFADNRATFGSV